MARHKKIERRREIERRRRRRRKRLKMRARMMAMGKEGASPATPESSSVSIDT